MWEGMADVIEAASSGWGIAALIVLGVFALAWKYGGQMLTALQENTRITAENNRVTKEVAETTAENNKVTKEVAESIITNHGSKNIGDAIDRLTDGQYALMEITKAQREDLATLTEDFYKHISDYAKNNEQEPSSTQKGPKPNELPE